MYKTTIPFPFMNVTYCIRLLTGFVITWATWRVPHVEQDLLTLQDRATEINPSFWLGSCCLFFSCLCCVMCTIVCLFVFFILRHDVVSLFWIYEFHCPSGMFHPSFIDEEIQWVIFTYFGRQGKIVILNSMKIFIMCLVLSN